MSCRTLSNTTEPRPYCNIYISKNIYIHHTVTTAWGRQPGYSGGLTSSSLHYQQIKECNNPFTNDYTKDTLEPATHAKTNTNVKSITMVFINYYITFVISYLLELKFGPQSIPSKEGCSVVDHPFLHKTITVKLWNTPLAMT